MMSRKGIGGEISDDTVNIPVWLVALFDSRKSNGEIVVQSLSFSRAFGRKFMQSLVHICLHRKELGEAANHGSFENLRHHERNLATKSNMVSELIHFFQEFGVVAKRCSNKVSKDIISID